MNYNYWVFNAEQLEGALAAAAEEPALSADDIAAVRAFLYSQVARAAGLMKTHEVSTDD